MSVEIGPCVCGAPDCPVDACTNSDADFTGHPPVFECRDCAWQALENTTGICDACESTNTGWH